MLNETLLAGRSFVKAIRIAAKILLCLSLIGILVYGGCVATTAMGLRCASLAAIGVKEGADCTRAQECYAQDQQDIEAAYKQRLDDIQNMKESAAASIEAKRAHANSAAKSLNAEIGIVNESLATFAQEASAAKVPTLPELGADDKREAVMKKLEACDSATAANKAALVAAPAKQYNEAIKLLDEKLATASQEKQRLQAELDELEAKYKQTQDSEPAQEPGVVKELPPNVYGQTPDAVQRVSGMRREIFGVAMYYPMSLEMNTRVSISDSISAAVKAIREWLPRIIVTQAPQKPVTEQPQWTSEDLGKRDSLLRSVNALAEQIEGIEKDKQAALDTKAAVEALLLENWNVDSAMDAARKGLDLYFAEVEKNSPEHYAQLRQDAETEKASALSAAAERRDGAVEEAHGIAALGRSVTRKTFIAAMTAYLLGPLGPLAMLLMVFLGYWLALVLADYLVCPLAMVTLTQELVRNGRKNQTDNN